MSLWTWVLLGLCIAGALLALGSIIAAAMRAVAIRRRVEALRRVSLINSMDSMRLQSARLVRITAQFGPLVTRARTAAESIRSNVRFR